MTEEYYYHFLGRGPESKLRQQTYHQILQGLRLLLPSFPVPRLEGSILSEIFTFVSLDHPEIFYAPSFTYRFYPQAENVEFIPDYLFKKKDIQEHQKAIQSRVQKLIRPYLNASDEEKEQFVHDFICLNVRYDKLKKSYSHEVIGPLTQGVGVCEGIAKTVKLLCDELKLPCLIAFCHNDPENGVKYRHAWNLVRLNGQYYHLDATFDNTLTRRSSETPLSAADIRYDYYNIDDKSLFRDHRPLVWPVPECPEDSLSYYRRNKLSFTKQEEVRKRASQAAKKGRSLTFHWRGSYLTKEVLSSLCSAMEEAGALLGKQPLLSLNWPQAILRIRYVEAPSDASNVSRLTMENSNEGEEN